MNYRLKIFNFLGFCILGFMPLFLVSVLLFGCENRRDCIDNSKNNVSYIKISDIEQNNFETFYGVVKSELSSELSFQTEGRIEYIPFQKGDYVKKGTVLARIDGILYKIKKNEELARLNDANLQLNQSQSYYKRMDALHKKGAISDNDWEDAYYNYQKNLQLVKIQKEKLRYIDEEISYNIIVAPYDGFIASKLADVGSYAKAGTPVYIINGNNKTQVEIMADSTIVGKLNLNEAIKVERNGVKYDGKIAHISKSSKNEGGYLIRIELDGLYDELKDGMSISALVANNDEHIAKIPLDSIFEKENEKYVYKIVDIKDNSGRKEGVIEQERVEIKNINDEEIEISKGINKGDIIIIKDLNKYKAGKKVKL